MKTVDRHTIRFSSLTRAVGAALFGTTVSALFLGPATLHAQAAPTDAQAQVGAKARSSAKTLKAVQVTAEKKTESEHDVPISMTVVEPAQMLETGQASIKDYYAQVPGLSVNDRGSGRMSLVIRGITAGADLNPTVGISIDDAPYGSSLQDYSISDIDPFDIDHIEVLKGPQGTLYGASSMGGLIKFSMVQPDLESVSGHVQADVSDTAHGGVGYSTRAAINLPLIQDRLAMRVSAFHRHDAGYVDDVLQHNDDINDGHADGGRLSVLWKPSDNISVHAAAMAQNSMANGGNRVDMEPNSYVPLYGAYAHSRLPGTDSASVHTRVYTLGVDASLGWADFHSVSSYNQYKLIGPQDVTGTFGGLARMVFGEPLGAKIVNDSKTGKFTQEFRLQSPDDGRKLSWLAGTYFTNEHTSTLQDVRVLDPVNGDDIGAPSLFILANQPQFKEASAFGSVTYAFTPKFDVQVGGRFSEVRQSNPDAESGLLIDPPTFSNDHARDNVWTYSFSPRYHVSRNLMTYFRVSTGYRAGGANQVLPQDDGQFPGQYTSDSLTSYEWGLKGDFADHTVSLDTSLFYIDWSDIQLNSISQATGSSYMVNAGSAKSEGAEATLNWLPLQGLTVTANAAYTHAVLTTNTPDGTYGLKGDRLPYSPAWQSSVTANYNFPLSGDWDGSIGGGVTYVGGRESSFTSSADARRFDLRSYTTVQLHAGVQSMDWNISLYVKNLTDARGFLSATPQNATTGVSSYGLAIIQPRTVGISATYQF
jgi:outer membrane receptor protein involved in Fe transport